MKILNKEMVRKLSLLMILMFVIGLMLFPVLPSYACDNFTTLCLPSTDDLTIEPTCTDEAGKKKWIIQNTSADDITVTWQVYNTAQSGTLLVPGSGAGTHGEATLYTDTVAGENILMIASATEWHSRESSAEACIPPPDDALTVIPECTDEAGKRKWFFRNKHDEPIKINWGIAGSDQRGELEIPRKAAGEAYGEAVLYTDALEVGNILFFYDGFTIKGEVEGIDEECLPIPGDSITIIPTCADKQSQRKWILRNTNEEDVVVTWEISGTTQGGTVIIPGTEAGEAYGEIVIYTDVVDEIDILYVFNNDLSFELESTDEACIPPPPTSGGGSSSNNNDDSDDSSTNDDGDEPADEVTDETMETETEEELIEMDEQLEETGQEEVAQDEAVLGEEPIQGDENKVSSLVPTEQGLGGALPKTATPWYNLILVSAVLLLGSGALLWRQRKQQS